MRWRHCARGGSCRCTARSPTASVIGQYRDYLTALGERVAECKRPGNHTSAIYEKLR
jgi:hypothetical protein